MNQFQDGFLAFFGVGGEGDDIVVAHGDLDVFKGSGAFGVLELIDFGGDDLERE